MPELNKLYLYRMTHMENLSYIVQYGITHSNAINANPIFKAIGDGSLINTQNSFIIENGRCLGDYVPFYFATRTPML